MIPATQILERGSDYYYNLETDLTNEELMANVANVVCVKTGKYLMFSKSKSILYNECSIFFKAFFCLI